MQTQIIQGSTVITTISLTDWLLKYATQQEKEAIVADSNEGRVYPGAIIVNGEVRVAV